jgi:hypothetical protein
MDGYKPNELGANMEYLGDMSAPSNPYEARQERYIQRHFGSKRSSSQGGRPSQIRVERGAKSHRSKKLSE